ncbi:hypothetical protein FISHEDRAFT_72144 [Fistulina hepatica ATCC 64428]|uniref:Uncharacterized protein n=1 Tax=Fistulina hepatica ATCC 64428 TaxID=1128425 RepID=A0A0D7AEX0_9AGAR|nr:hypothetical protein FISHEDRAFT_72144 [Fistulina hepatica ATCC 64428]
MHPLHHASSALRICCAIPFPAPRVCRAMHSPRHAPLRRTLTAQHLYMTSPLVLTLRRSHARMTSACAALVLATSITRQAHATGDSYIGLNRPTDEPHIYARGARKDLMVSLLTLRVTATLQCKSFRAIFNKHRFATFMSHAQDKNAERGSTPEPEIQAAAISSCEGIVERFRTGDISKTRAVIEIQRSIPFAGDFNDEDALAAHALAMQSFYDKLESYERLRESTAGSTEATGNSGSTPRGEPAHEEEETSERAAKRPRRANPEENEEGDESGRKLDVARLPWNSRKTTSDLEGASAGPSLSSGATQYDARTLSILRSIKILETINVDAKRAKTNLLLSLDVPQFPESQWTKLLSGATVDFDHVLSGLYASADVERTTERIGNIEFSYASTSPTKRVTTFGDWTTAFESFAEAFTFIFPHRVDEVRTYSQHIKSFFKARPAAEHSGVIAYDSADLQIRFIFGPAGSTNAGSSFSPAETGMLGYAPGPLPHVIMPMYAQSAASEDTSIESVKRNVEKRNAKEKPRYARDLVWSDSSHTPRISLAETSFTAPAVPEPPEEEVMNLTALWTITDNPHLFKVDTPVNVDTFENLLESHPNRDLVHSVCRSLRDGFWPWASAQDRDYPETFDNAEGRETLLDPAHSAFAKRQIAAEVDKGRFSPAFGPGLLPGMYSVPVWVVPKPHSDKLRLVVDHSAGQYSLNSLIPKSERGLHLDGLQQLGEALIRARETYGDRPLVVWKSDVSEAYRLLPMHPLWQIKQTVSFDGERRVDWRNNFGSGGSGRVWATFFSLVLWIAVFIKFIVDLFAYVDDTFSWDFADNIEWYEPYQTFYPKKQAQLLKLWDKIGVPHEKHKQESGTSLVVIGLLVDTCSMTISMPDHSREDLAVALRGFAVPRQRRPLVHFQRLGGWVNWALNVFPLLRPGLSTLYAKIKGKEQPYLVIWVSVRLCRELIWIAEHIQSSHGIHMLKSRTWTPDQADLVVYTDASNDGMAYYIPSIDIAFQCPSRTVKLPRGISRDRIFYFEALAVVSAIVQVLQPTTPTPHRLAIWTDNTNTVDMFDSLHALPPYNPLLITSADLLMFYECDLRVFHVKGKDNKVADALSRFQNDLATTLAPGLRIFSFIPPRLTSGAALI